MHNQESSTSNLVSNHTFLLIIIFASLAGILLFLSSINTASMTKATTDNTAVATALSELDPDDLDPLAQCLASEEATEKTDMDKIICDTANLPDESI